MDRDLYKCLSVEVYLFRPLLYIETLIAYFGMRKFAGGIMCVLHEVFGLPSAKMMTDMDEQEGKFHRYIRMNLRNLRFVKHYPTEALSEPLFRTWFAMWKKTHRIR